MNELTFITSNKGKYEECKQFFPELQQEEVDLPEIQSLKPEEIIKEKLLKAKKEIPRKALIVEDTSLLIKGLGGLPGPFIKWFIKAMGPENLARTAILSGDPSAIALVKIGYLNKKGNITFFEGRSKGSIVLPRGSNGFGWDTIFLPEGEERTFGEMSREEKKAISMRGKACKQLRDHLKKEDD